MGIMANGERLNHLQFADDIVLIGNDGTEIEDMLNLNDESRTLGLKINMKKTKIMYNKYTTKSVIQIGTQSVTKLVNTST